VSYGINFVLSRVKIKNKARAGAAKPTKGREIHECRKRVIWFSKTKGG